MNDQDHGYRPRNPDEPWGLCVVCGYAQAAHLVVVAPYVSDAPRAKPKLG
jgi:hypothetical protein